MSEVTRAAAKSKGLEIVQILGKGNYGSAFLVRDMKNHPYALKEIPKNNFYDMEWTSSQLVVGKSDYVIRLYKKFEFGPNVYILMEYANKKSLENLLKGMKPYSIDISVNILFQILNGLQTIHENHLTHRDLKPANILMHQVKGNQFITLKIADFGLSRPITEQELARTYCGTPLHMAPEILLSDEAEYDERVDIWSVGTIFYQLLTGNYPFPARNMDHLKKIIQEPLPHSPLITNEDCWALLKGMLMVDPVNRFSAYRCLCSPLFKTCWSVLKRTGPPGEEVTHHVLLKGDPANRAFTPYISLTESISRRMAGAGVSPAQARNAAAGAAAAAQPAAAAAGPTGRMAAFSAFIQHALMPVAAALTRVPAPAPVKVPAPTPAQQANTPTNTPPTSTAMPTTATPTPTPTAVQVPMPSPPPAGSAAGGGGGGFAGPDAASPKSSSSEASSSSSVADLPPTSSSSSSSSSATELLSSPSSTPSSSSSSSSESSSESSSPSSSTSSSEIPDIDLFRSISLPNAKDEPDLKKDGSGSD